MKFVLVHGPPAGPATWRWVAEELTSAGHEVVVPDLRRAAMSGQPAAVVREAVAACSTDTDVVAGHSGAGLMLPAIADSLASRPRPRLVFVDAAIPECDRDARLNPVVADLLRPLAVEGILPPGFLWSGEGGLERLIPDSEMRARVEAELPELPMTLFEEGLPVADGWCEWRCDYLLLSEEMRGEAERGRSIGWPVFEDLGNHLDVVNRAAEVASDLLLIAG